MNYQNGSAYCQYAHAAFEGERVGPGGTGFDFTSFSDIFNDLFSEFMGGRAGGGRSSANRGSDLRYNLEITLEDCYQGKAAKIRVPTSVSCQASTEERRVGKECVSTCRSRGSTSH